MVHADRVRGAGGAGAVQGLEALHPSLRKEHEAASDQGHTDDTSSDLRLRRMQDLLAGGESWTFVFCPLWKWKVVFPD